MLAGIGHSDCFFNVGGSQVWYPLLGEDSGPGICKTRSGFAQPFSAWYRGDQKLRGEGDRENKAEKTRAR